MRNYRIRILPRAVADLDSIISWIYDQSPRGAAALLVAFEKAQTGLKRSPEAYSIAPESDVLGVELRQGVLQNSQRQHLPDDCETESRRSSDPANPWTGSASVDAQ